MSRLHTRPILLVEDDLDSRIMLTTFLMAGGLGVVSASNGREAYNLARQHVPSVILLDLMMPVMSGEEFRHAQLADADISGIPVVVLSAHHRAPHIAQRMKAAGCLMKPVDLDVLTSTLQRILQRAGPASRTVAGVTVWDGFDNRPDAPQALADFLGERLPTA